jgi:beta-lactamase class A
VDDLSTRVDAAWHAALDRRVPHASWSVRLDGELLSAHEPDRRFVSASMIKTFVLAVALDAVERGELDLEAASTVAAERRAYGDGLLRHAPLPLDLPLRELLRLMIAISDNTATNAVLDAVGGLTPLNERLATWGFDARMRSYVSAAGPAWPEGATLEADDGLPTRTGLAVLSVAEHERLLAAIDGGELLPATGAQAIAILRQQADRTMLARLAGEEPPFAHKTGAVDGVRHDGGLFSAGGRELAVTCFTDGEVRAEWVDHPALVGMGLAMAWTLAITGVPHDPPPGVPDPPEGA